jgi:death-on-curing protein
MIEFLLQTTKTAHEKLMEDYGGSKGIRDRSGLEAAINRPFATFDGVDLYVDSIAKSAAIFESLLINHPFIDGNKRIGYFMMEFILYSDGKEVCLTEDEKYDFVIQVAEGKMHIDQITKWIQENATDLSS